MRAARGDPPHTEFMNLVVVHQQIDDVLAGCMPACDDDRARTHAADSARGLARRVGRDDTQTAQRFSFGNVWRDDPRARQQLDPERTHAILVDQPLAARGHEHRADHDQRQIELSDGGGHGFHNRRGGEHADLRRLERQVARNRLDLRRHQIGRGRGDAVDADRVLDRNRGDCARAVHTQGGKRLEVGLNARTAARVAARDCQRCPHTLRSALMQPTLLATVATRNDSRALRTAEQIGAAALGARLGMMSQILYLALGIAGLPMFAASPSLPQGAARLLGPTGGYLMAYPFAAFAAGWLAECGFDRRYLTAVAAMACGLAVVFAGGLSWLALYVQPMAGFGGAIRIGFTPFIVADLVKLLVAAGVMPSLWWIRTRRDR